MHGVSRAAYAARPEAELAALREKAAKYQALEGALFRLRDGGVQSPEALELSAKLLRINPDAFTFWNYRREMLLAPAPETEELELEVATAELQLTAEALRRSPKSYPAWHQRRWVLDRLGSDRQEVYDQELALCASFLDKDERNFHCWKHRRYVAGLAGVTPEADFAYTQDRLDVNFSNYSAFHQRSQALLRLESFRADPVEVLGQELDLVQQITITEPEDQSAWWYYRFLLAKLTDADEIPAETSAERLGVEADRLRELLELERDTKWGLVMLAHVLGLLGEEAHAEAAEVYEKLMELDADRKEYYEAKRQALRG